MHVQHTPQHFYFVRSGSVRVCENGDHVFVVVRFTPTLSCFWSTVFEIHTLKKGNLPPDPLHTHTKAHL